MPLTPLRASSLNKGIKHGYSAGPNNPVGREEVVRDSKKVSTLRLY